MALREKGGMWCSACDRPVTARKTGRRARNTATVAGVPLTGGLSLLFARSDRWHCSNCGGPVIRAPYSPAESLRRRTDGEPTVTVLLIGRGEKIPTIKALRASTGAHLAVAEAWYRNAPSRIEALPATVAADLVARLTSVGATAEVEGSREVAPDVDEQMRALDLLEREGTLTADEVSVAKRRLLDG